MSLPAHLFARCYRVVVQHRERLIEKRSTHARRVDRGLRPEVQIRSGKDRQRQQSARTKGRSDVEGSTRKLYRQKGTGNARAGNLRTPIRRGGGRAFAKRGPRAKKAFPKKMRRLARNSAILARIQANDVIIVDEFRCPEIKTKVVASMLSALGGEKGCVLFTFSWLLHEMKCRIIVVTDGMTADELGGVHLDHASSVQQAADDALSSYAGGASIGIMPYGGLVLPTLPPR